MSIYDFKVTARDGSEVALEQYRGKVIARFEPTVSMKKVAAAVAEAL